MIRSTWRSWIAAPLAVLGLIAAIAASPPIAEAKANTSATNELVVVKNVDVTVAINVTTSNVPELNALDGLHVAWTAEYAIPKIAGLANNGPTVASALAMNMARVTNSTAWLDKVNISPQATMNSAINDTAARGDNVAQPASNPAAPRPNMSKNNISPQATSRGGVVLASTGGGWVDTALAMLRGRFDGRVS